MLELNHQGNRIKSGRYRQHVEGGNARQERWNFTIELNNQIIPDDIG